MSIKQDYKPDSTWKSRRQVRFHGLLVITLVLIGLFGSLLAFIGRHKAEVINTSQAPVKVNQDLRAKRSSEPPATPPPTVKPKYDFYQVLPQRQVVITKSEIYGPAPKQDTHLPPEMLTKTAPPSAVNQSVSSTSLAKLSESATLTDGHSTRQSTLTSTVKPTAAPASSSARSAQPPLAPPPAAKAIGSYFIQVGSFRNYTEADRRKASVAFLGINARIEAGTGADGGTLHRVRIGPIKNQDQLKTLLQRLQENNIPSIPVKVN